MNLWRLHATPASIIGYVNRLVVSEIAFEALRDDNISPEIKSFAITSVAKSSEFAYLYARYVIKGRFPLGETAISKNSEFSYLYSLFIIKGRFELGEVAIKADFFYAIEYATNVCEGELYKSGRQLSGMFN